MGGGVSCRFARRDQVHSSGPVWDSLPQTPQAAEQVAIAVVSDLASSPVVFHSECLGAVRLANKPEPSHVAAEVRYAAVRRHALRRNGHEHVQQAEHTPAHRSVEVIQALSEPVKRIALGNKHVDEHANLACKCHPEPDQHRAKALDKESHRIETVLAVLAQTLPLYLRLQLERRPMTHVGRTKRIATGECLEWEYGGSTWRCMRCLVSGAAFSDGGELPLNGSPGLPKVLQRVMARQESLGHQLQRCDTKDCKQSYFCTLCGALGCTQVLESFAAVSSSERSAWQRRVERNQANRAGSTAS